MIGPKKGEEILGMSSDRTRFSSSEAQMYCDSKDKEALVETIGACVCVESSQRTVGSAGNQLGKLTGDRAGQN
jgi:hypothetical protein